MAGAAGITVSEDGKNVYVTGSGADSVVAFRRDGTKGELTWIETQTNGVNGVTGLRAALSVDVSPDGKNVYVASLADGAVTVFKRDAATGQLSFVEASAKVAGVDASVSAEAIIEAGAVIEAEEATLSVISLYWALVVSPDSKYVYAARWSVCDATYEPCGNLVVFARQAKTGILSQEQVLRNDDGDIRGLRTPMSVAVSADGLNVYSTSIRDSSVLTFKVVGSAEYTDREYMPYMMRE